MTSVDQDQIACNVPDSTLFKTYHYFLVKQKIIFDKTRYFRLRLTFFLNLGTGATLLGANMVAQSMCLGELISIFIHYIPIIIITQVPFTVKHVMVSAAP